MNLNLIPQVFYDLIARVIPGTVLLWCSYITYYGYPKCIIHVKELLKNNFEANFLLIAEIIVLGYILSLILSGIWVKVSIRITHFKKSLASPIWSKVNETLANEVKNTAKSMGYYESIKDVQVPSISFIYDLLRLKMPDVGARLVKVRAECHMCSVLFVGWIILALLNLLNFFHKPFIDVIVTEIFYAISIISIFYYLKYLEERFIKGIGNYWILFQLNKNSEI